jgi:transcriptional regulator with XRE-family HTH domain
MERSTALVQLALDGLKCTQKELAQRMGVTPGQISKWKSGEYIANEQEKKLAVFAGIGERHPEVVLSAGSIADSDRWDRLINILAEDELNDVEGIGSNTFALLDEDGYLVLFLFQTLQDMGVAIPRPFPVELDFDYRDAADDDHCTAFGEAMSANKLVALIRRIFESLSDLRGFYDAFIQDLVLSGDEELYEAGHQIELNLLGLAAAKLNNADPELAPNFRSFQRQEKSQQIEWLSDLKEVAMRKSIPLKAELLDLVYKPTELLMEADEAELSEENSTRLHPDIYINELLVGMREIRAALPAIQKALKIKTESTK